MSRSLRMARRRPLYRGWVMVAVGFVAVAVVFGGSGATLPFVYVAVLGEFGWSLTDAALLFAYKNVTAATASFLCMAPLLKRFGLRPVMIGSLVVTALGMLAFMLVDSLPMFYAAGALLGLGSATAMVGVNIFVSRWFFRNQGLGLGVALAGTSVGGALFPFLTIGLMESIGWRATMAALSLLIWLVALPVYLWKAHETPTAEDVAPELEPRRAAARTPAFALDAAHTAAPFRSMTFWKIALALTIVAAVDTAVIQHTPLLLMSEAGLSPELAAVGQSVIFAFGVLGKLLAGKVYDALSLRGIALWYLFLAVSIALAFPVGGTVTLMVFAVARGLAHGGLIPKPAVLAKHCYGQDLLNVMLPVFMGLWLIGAGAGPVLLAMSHDATGHYREGLLLLVITCVAAAALIRSAIPRRRSEHSAPRSAAPGEEGT